MPYQFRLQPLLRIRRVYEQREWLRLALLHASRIRTADERDEIASDRAKRFDRLEQSLERGMPGADFQPLEAELQLMLGHQKELAALLEALQLQIQTQTEHFQQAQASRKMLENLDAREKQAYELIQNRREQQRIDDLFARRGGVGSGG